MYMISLPTAFLRTSAWSTKQFRPASALTLRWFSDAPSTKPDIFEAKSANVFPFGTPSDDPSKALFLDLNWTISDEACWAILPNGGTSSNIASLADTVLANVRFSPPKSASHPILATLPPKSRPKDEGGPRAATVKDLVQLVSFKTRLRGTGGGFDDYTARYYAIRDEDKLTVRQHLGTFVPYSETSGGEDDKIERMADLLEMSQFLDLPLVTLSNGQTRRARILQALLAEPELLILEEPYTGLDVASRSILTKVLASLHSSRSPRVLLILRPQDEMPPFVTHIALTGEERGAVRFGDKEEILALPDAKKMIAAGIQERRASEERMKKRAEAAATQAGGAAVVALKKVNVTYGGDRRVLVDIDWTIREGERWMLSGHNGSGKSTLLSIILGDHPRSYVEDVTLFGRPRDKQGTATLQGNIGHVSPEIFNAFPRKHGDAGLTAKESIVTGFESIYSYRKITPEQETLLQSLLVDMEHPLLTPTFLSKLFVELTPGEQSLVLLLRALVKRPPLLVLDEAFSGMDKETIDIVKRYLDTKLDAKQAAIYISHFEEELPESVVRMLKLENGRVVDRV